MAILKRLSIFMSVFALVGVVGVTAATPSVLGWYNSPGGGGGAMCNCVELARTTATNIIQTQLVGLLVGALSGLALGVFMVARQRKHDAALLAAAAVPTVTSEIRPS